MDLTGRVAVVIGGTSGIGREMAIGLAEAGAHVVPTGRREQQIDDVCLEIEKAGVKTIRQVCDAGSRASVDQFRDATLAAFGQVDILINARRAHLPQAHQGCHRGRMERPLRRQSNRNSARLPIVPPAPRRP